MNTELPRSASHPSVQQASSARSRRLISDRVHIKARDRTNDIAFLINMAPRHCHQFNFRSIFNFAINDDVRSALPLTFKSISWKLPKLGSLSVRLCFRGVFSSLLLPIDTTAACFLGRCAPDK